MKKIGILTFQFADNFGALLQAYALRKYISDISDKDTQVEIINYANKQLKQAYNINPFYKKNMKQFIKATVLFLYKYGQYCKFKKFRVEKLGIQNPENFDINLRTGFDCYVVGSDQVWNNNITFDDKTYYLKDIENEKQIKRVSYAASADNAFLATRDKERIIALLKRFDAISVREKQIKDILIKQGNIDSSMVLDPVFLVSKAQWSLFGKEKKSFEGKYILYYSLKENELLDTIAIQLKRELKIPIIVVHPTLRRITSVGKLETGVGPEEFVKLIENAEAVVSNSFHAFAFSCIFSKEIYFDYVEETSNRVKNLIDMVKIPIKKKDEIFYCKPNIYSTKEFNAKYNESIKFIRKNILNSSGRTRYNK